MRRSAKAPVCVPDAADGSSARGRERLAGFYLRQVAARLAGGFLYPGTPDLLEPAIKMALDEGGYAELEAVRTLPSMTTLGLYFRETGFAT